MRTAILVDGGFYRKQAKFLFGEKTPKQRADELVSYCMRHIEKGSGDEGLYRIFYYDCPPSEKNIYHPLLNKSVDLKKSEMYSWSLNFFKELTHKRKLAIRRGELLESSSEFVLNPEAVKKLCRKEITIDDLTENDFYPDIKQKGVDMRIGLDIASLAHKRLVDKIVLIAGDSDFVPAAKYARREGIDFVLDPMWHTIKDSLNEHIDGLESKVKRPPFNEEDQLHINVINKKDSDKKTGCP